MSLLDCFDRLAIIHLPDRRDRLVALRLELSRIGIDIGCSKVSIPKAPMPEAANGFPSRGVYGNFLSHLEIIESAYRDGLNSVWVLEDDAIFSRRMKSEQQAFTRYLRAGEWDLFYIGHSIAKGLPVSPTGLLCFSERFMWAHCYAVHRRIMPRLIEYLRSTIDRDAGHPDGGKMYINSAYFLFRKFNPDVISIVSSPRLSVQKGSPSSLHTVHWYDRNFATRILVEFTRGNRDETWRRGWLSIGSKGHPYLDFTASTWPSAMSGYPID